MLEDKVINSDSVETKNGKRIYTHQEKTDTKEDPIELQDGKEVKIGNEIFIYKSGRFLKPDPKEEKSHYYLYFKKPYIHTDEKVEWPKEVNGFEVTERGKYLLVDIYPMVEKLAGAASRIYDLHFAGIEYNSGSSNEISVPALTLGYDERHKLQSKIERMFDMSIPNQNQLKGFKGYVEELFNSVWDDFYNNRW